MNVSLTLDRELRKADNGTMSWVMKRKGNRKASQTHTSKSQKAKAIQTQLVRPASPQPLSNNLAAPQTPGVINNLYVYSGNGNGHTQATTGGANASNSLRAPLLPQTQPPQTPHQQQGARTATLKAAEERLKQAKEVIEDLNNRYHAIYYDQMARRAKPLVIQIAVAPTLQLLSVAKTELKAAQKALDALR